MPDQLLMMKAAMAAALVAAALALLGAWRPRFASAVSALSVGLGFFIGCRLLGANPKWPPAEDQDRFLYLLFPAVILAELLALPLGKWRWLPRLAIAAVAGRVLLHNTTFIADLAGPGSREWTPAQTWAILGSSAAALAGVWVALGLLAHRAPSRTVPLAVSMACGAAAITVMLSGYASGGMLGIPLTAAIAGTALVLPARPGNDSVLGPGVVGLFALLIVGRFFGNLSTLHAALLFAAPLAVWLPELPGVRRLGPRLRGALRLTLVAIPLIAVVLLAKAQFDRDSVKVSGSDPNEPTLDDYLNFGK